VIQGPVLQEVTLNAIQAEATRAHLLHRENSVLNPDMTDDRRLSILVEEVGEVATDLNDRELGVNGMHDKDHLVQELLQVAAMAASFAQAVDQRPS
jgi:hypothetical protein